ncbi:hypothetical protein O0L34_g8376 [Tuta absoluta]|nr:hypothetical protein O0L34_g8376 [Tuta absoluta]
MSKTNKGKKSPALVDSNPICVKCNIKINKKRSLYCSYCSKTYCQECTNTEKLFYLIKNKSTWKCKTCTKGTPNRYIQGEKETNLPLDQQQETKHVESTKSVSSPTRLPTSTNNSVSSPLEVEKYSVHEDVRRGVTVSPSNIFLNAEDDSTSRESNEGPSGIKINVPTSNSFESLLVEDKDLTITAPHSTIDSRTSSTDPCVLEKAADPQKSVCYVTQRIKDQKGGSCSFDVSNVYRQITHQSLPELLVDSDELNELREELQRLKMELLSTEEAIEELGIENHKLKQKIHQHECTIKRYKSVGIVCSSPGPSTYLSPQFRKMKSRMPLPDENESTNGFNSIEVSFNKNKHNLAASSPKRTQRIASSDNQKS